MRLLPISHTIPAHQIQDGALIIHDQNLGHLGFPPCWSPSFSTVSWPRLLVSFPGGPSTNGLPMLRGEEQDGMELPYKIG